MEILFDLHTHTIMSGHAYNTIEENIVEAYNIGLQAYGFSDHGPAIEGGPAEVYFRHFRIFPRHYKNMYVLCGVEAVITDYEGHIDLNGKALERVDYAIASLHSWCLQPGTCAENMRAYRGAMQNLYVKIIGHPDDQAYETDYDELAYMAQKYGVALELNESSLDPESVRSGSVREKMRLIMKYCRRYQTPVILGSDAHHKSYIGRFEQVRELLASENFPQELVLNNSLVKLRRVLNHPDIIK